MSLEKLYFTNIFDRLMTKIVVSPDTACWHYTGYLNKAGYGLLPFLRDGMQVPHYAHRVSYEAFRGPVPKGLQVDHLCRVRDCINPWHLEPVTPLENTRRSLVSVVQKARHARRTHCKHGHGFTKENTYIYVDKNGVPARICRICRKRADDKFNGRL